MRIRTQLGVFFLLMGGIAVSFGALTLWGGYQVVDAFSHSLSDMEKLSRIRNLQVLLARQKASLDSYFLVNDPQELERFQEMGRLVYSRLEEIKKSAPAETAIDRLRSLFDEAMSSAKRTADLYTWDRRRAMRQASDALLPSMGRFFDGVGQTESRFEKEIHDTHTRVRRLVVLGRRIVFAGGLGAALFGFLFAWALFRLLNSSLFELQRGTEAFGGGKWDYRIPLSTQDELGDLARSFNQMAENIKHLETQTVHMHRMSAVGQLAGGVAHEINNPLTGVLGQAQLLLDKLPADNPHRANIEKIERAALRCRRIVRSLLDFSRQKETPQDYFHVNEVIDAALDLCEMDLQNHRVTVLKNLSPGVAQVLGNAAQIQQVFLNVAANAIQAMPGGGVLTISTRTGFFRPQGGDRDVEAVEANFVDTGQGIDQEHLPHVFEPFFTTKEIGKGTGLGLSVSLGIIRHHGGDIVAESAGLGKGATFRIFLPTDVATTMPIAVAPEADAAQGRGPYAGTNPRY